VLESALALKMGWALGIRMDDLHAGKPSQYFNNEPPRPTQHPALSGTGNEYQPKCDDAVRLGSKSSDGRIFSPVNGVRRLFPPKSSDGLRKVEASWVISLVDVIV